MANDTVLLNHRIKLYDLNKGKTLYVTVVMPRYADANKQLVSAFSHFGVALLGAKLHSTVKVQQAWLQRIFLITAIGPADKRWQKKTLLQTKERKLMSKKRMTKKEPQKSLKEKRREKKQKRIEE